MHTRSGEHIGVTTTSVIFYIETKSQLGITGPSAKYYPDGGCQWKDIAALSLNKNAAAIEPSHYSCWRVSAEGTRDGGRMPPI